MERKKQGLYIWKKKEKKWGLDTRITHLVICWVETRIKSELWESGEIVSTLNYHAGKGQSVVFVVSNENGRNKG